MQQRDLSEPGGVLEPGCRHVPHHGGRLYPGLRVLQRQGGTTGMERELAERYLKRLKTLLLIAGISVTVGIVGVVMHNVQYAINEVEEPVFFSVALVGLWVFSMTTAASVVILLKGRRKAT